MPRFTPGLSIAVLGLAACGPSEPQSSTEAPLPLSDTAEPLDTDTPEDTAEPTDTAPPVAPVEPVCSVSPDHIVCPHETLDITTGLFTSREVHWQVPNGTPPAEGWPVALLFQGSLFTAELFWEARDWYPYGAIHQSRTVADLLDAGFIVVAPEASLNGATFWNTNVPPFSIAWETSPDHELMLGIFDALETGTIPDADADRLYATGISSGGYMSSRMAEAYASRFRAVAVHSASWATCSGPLCFVPDSLPADHPPTLLLHGEVDLIVPISTMYDYADALDRDGIPYDIVTDPDVDHAWIPAAPDAITDWFVAHP